MRDASGNTRASDEAAEVNDFLNISLVRHNRQLGQAAFTDAAGRQFNATNGALTGFYGMLDSVRSKGRGTEGVW